MEHSIISEPGLLISDNASGISGMTPLSDAIERMSSTIRYRTVFSPYGRDMLEKKGHKDATIGAGPPVSVMGVGRPSVRNLMPLR